MIHQLDYATSGVLLLGLQRRPTAQINAAFRNREVRKRYFALVHGHVNLNGQRTHFTIEAPLLEYDDDFRMRLAPSKVLEGDPIRDPASTVVALKKIEPMKCPETARCSHLPPKVVSLAKNLARKSPSSAQSPACDSQEHDQVVHLVPHRVLEPLPGAVPKKMHSAVTHGVVIMTGSFCGVPATLLELLPETGRRHQLRVHLWGIGHGIIGDATYPTLPDEDERFSRMMLHAAELELPSYIQERLHLPSRFEAPLPSEMMEFVSDASVPCVEFEQIG
jgi:23S rRNA-/tRNA-specific pseudouridylate synthase